MPAPRAIDLLACRAPAVFARAAYFSFEDFSDDHLRDHTGHSEGLTPSAQGPGDSGGARLTTAGRFRKGLDVGGCSEDYCYGHNAYFDAQHADPIFASDFTVSLWFTSARPSRWDQDILLSKQGLFTLRRESSSGTIEALLGEGSTLVVLRDDSGIVIGQDQWHHVSLVRRGNEFSLQVDGKGAASAHVDVMAQSAALEIGKSAAGYPWEGTLDEIVLWSRALDDAERAALTDVACALSHDLQAYYRFDGDLSDAIEEYPAMRSLSGRDDVLDEAAFGEAGARNQALGVGGCTSEECWGQNGSISAHALLSDGVRDFTVSMWVFSTQESRWDQNALVQVPGLFRVRRMAFGETLELIVGDGYQEVTIADGPATTIGENQWHHVVVMKTGDVYSLIVDGHAATRASAPASETIGARMYLGRFESGYPWEGMLDEVAVWNRALGADELSRLN